MEFGPTMLRGCAEGSCHSSSGQYRGNHMVYVPGGMSTPDWVVTPASEHHAFLHAYSWPFFMPAGRPTALGRHWCVRRATRSPQPRSRDWLGSRLLTLIGTRWKEGEIIR